MARESQDTQLPVGFMVAPTLTEPTLDGDIVDTGAVRIMVENLSGAAMNVTVQATATVEGLEVADLVVPVADGAIALIGPLPKTIFGQSGVDLGRAYVDYTAQTGVTRAVVGW